MIVKCWLCFNDFNLMPFSFSAFFCSSNVICQIWLSIENLETFSLSRCGQAAYLGKLGFSRYDGWEHSIATLWQLRVSPFSDQQVHQCVLISNRYVLSKYHVVPNSSGPDLIFTDYQIVYRPYKLCLQLPTALVKVHFTR